MEDQIDRAVEAAREAYDEANHNPLDHGHAWISVDGRTSVAHAMREHPDVSLRTDGETTATISGVDRYLGAQRSAYRAFLDALDVDTNATIKSHGH